MPESKRSDAFAAIDDLTANLRGVLDSANAAAKTLLTLWLESLEIKSSNQKGTASAMPEDSLMTADDVAEFVGLKRDTIYAWAKDNSIPHLKLKGELRFQRSVLIAWMTPNKNKIHDAREKSRGCAKVKPLFPAAKQIRSNNNGRL